MERDLQDHAYFNVVDHVDLESGRQHRLEGIGIQDTSFRLQYPSDDK